MFIIRRANRKLQFIWGFIKALVLGRLHSHRYRKISTFVLFTGYPRSGHSLIAAILDAHPNIVISMEWGALSHLRLGYGKKQLVNAIERHARLFTTKLKNEWTGYSYRIEGLWQGRSEDIYLIGDKLAGQTSLILREYPHLLKKLQLVTRLDIKLLHVIRNPYDTIATMARRSLEKSGNPEGPPDLKGFAGKYFDRVRLVNSLRNNKDISIFDIYHEDFILDPGKSLEKLLAYLEAAPINGYLEKCAGIVYGSPNKSRYQYEWTEELKQKVQREINSYEFLDRYTFNS